MEIQQVLKGLGTRIVQNSSNSFGKKSYNKHIVFVPSPSHVFGSFSSTDWKFKQSYSCSDFSNQTSRHNLAFFDLQKYAPLYIFLFFFFFLGEDKKKRRQNLTSQLSFTSFILFHKEMPNNRIKIIDQINTERCVYRA